MQDYEPIQYDPIQYPTPIQLVRENFVSRLEYLHQAAVPLSILGVGVIAGLVYLIPQYFPGDKALIAQQQSQLEELQVAVEDITAERDGQKELISAQSKIHDRLRQQIETLTTQANQLSEQNTSLTQRLQERETAIEQIRQVLNGGQPQ